MHVVSRPFIALGRLLAVLSVTLMIASLARSAHAETPPPPQGVVNINTASAEELMLLPRIGEGKARRIIELRTKTPFKSVNDIARVKGIGLKTLRILKPYLRLDGPTTLTSEVKVDSGDGGEPTSSAPKTPPRALPSGGPGGATGATTSR